MFIIRRVKNRKNRKITFVRKHPSSQTFIGEWYRVVLGQDKPKKKGAQK